jgi:hypothetical protein
MKEKLEQRFNLTKSIIKGLAIPFALPSVWSGRFYDLLSEDYSKFEKSYFQAITAMSTLLCPTFVLPPIFYFSRGHIKEGLITSIPLITNLISGVYEIYNKAKKGIEEK